jgi:hypothetical protein
MCQGRVTRVNEVFHTLINEIEINLMTSAECCLSQTTNCCDAFMGGRASEEKAELAHTRPNKQILFI